MQKTKLAYFENLDGIRFLAFMLVFLRHYFDFSSYTPSPGFENLLLNNFVLNGGLGVNLFFVLSGFLITYLLIREKENNSNFNIKYFYIRRVLRIWPLYFLVIILNFFIIPLITHKFSLIDIKEHILPYSLFLNNFDVLNTGFVGVGNDNLVILWSVAVEEQFYLVWPILLFIVNKKYYNYIFCVVILFCLLYRCIYVDNKYIIYYHTFSVMSDLAVGGLLAYNVFRKTTFTNFIKHLKKPIIISVYLFLLVAIVFHQEWSQFNTITKIFERLGLSFFFAFIIAEQCYSDNSFFKFGNLKKISKLGVISYGLYCLHLLSLVIVQKLNIMLHINQNNSYIFYAELFVCLFLSILMSYLSYTYFEKIFLNLKYKFAATYV